MTFCLAASWFEISEIEETRRETDVFTSFYITLNHRSVAVLTDSHSVRTDRHDHRKMTLYSLITNSVVNLWPEDQKMSWNQAFETIANTDPDIILGEKAVVPGAKATGKKIKLDTRFGFTAWVTGVSHYHATVTLNPLEAAWIESDDVERVMDALLGSPTHIAVKPPIPGDQFIACEISNRRKQLTQSWQLEDTLG